MRLILNSEYYLCQSQVLKNEIFLNELLRASTIEKA